MLVRPLSTVDNTRDYARVSHSRQWSNYNLINYNWLNWITIRLQQPISAWFGWYTFEVDEETTLGKTGSVDDKSNVGNTGVDFDGVSAECAAVPEVRRGRRQRRRWRPVPRRRSWHGRYLDEVLTASCPLYIQLEVKNGEAYRLPRLDSDPPSTLGVHVILVRVVGTGQVATTVQFDGWCLVSGRRRQRGAPAVDQRN